VIVSERIARRLFPRATNSVGRTIHVNGVVHSIIGVMSREAGAPGDPTAVWLLPPPAADLAAIPFSIIRLRHGLTAAELDRTRRVLVARFAIAAGVPERVVAMRLGGFIGAQARIGLLHYALIAAVLAVLLVACANIANLQLARGIARSRELATRAALGATRRDLVTHLVVESALIGAAGLALGLLLTFWGMHLIRASVPDSIGEYIVEPQTSWRVFTFAAAATTVCVLLIGFLPALRVSRVDVNELLKRGSGTGSMRSARRQYGFLVSAEIGFALAVVCGASLLVRAAMQLTAASKVWDQSMLSVALVRVNAPLDSAWAFDGIADDILSPLRAQPDIAAAAVMLRVTDEQGEITGTISGGTPRVIGAPLWSYDVVTPGTLRTLGFDVAHGRDFREGEAGAAAIINSTLARRLWPGGSAVGQMIKFGSSGKPGRWFTVVGVRRPVGVESVDGKVEAYVLPGPDDRLAGAEQPWRRPMLEVVVRARRNPQRGPLTVRQRLTPDQRLNVVAAQPFDEQEAMKRANTNFISALFGVFALLALGLAAVGVYGIMSHAVAERRREIGVRIALGSSRRNILHAVLREGNVFALAGVAIGLLLIMRGAPLVRGFLVFPEVDLYSIELYVPAAMLLFATAVVAALVPAVRATRVDPVEAMRCE
jgi:predicted permease